MKEEHILDAGAPLKKPKRPVFLTVLCIHTWIGSALLFYVFWREYATAMETAEQLKGLYKGAWGMVDSGDTFYKYLRQQIFHALVQMTCCALCVAGTIFLWRLRKWGFYVYLIGELGSLAVTLWLIASLDLLRFDLIGGLLYVLLFVFPLGFTTLYALNLKHLRS